TAGAIALHGYQFGEQDQFVYLPAIKYHVDPSLYPGGTDIFLTQTKLMVFDEIVALSIRATRLPFDWAIFLWHAFSIWLLLLGCFQINRRLFVDSAAQWAGVAGVAALFLLAVAATMLELVDPHLHPRTLATAFLLLSFASVLNRSWRALLWLACAFLVHPLMAAYGAFHLVFQVLPWSAPLMSAVIAASAVPQVAAGKNAAWHELLQTRWFLFPLRWPWYAWFGVVVPLGLVAWWSTLREQTASPLLRSVSGRLFISGTLGTIGGILITVVPQLERLVPAEPMRTLHLVNLMTVLLGMGLLGQHFLQRKLLRWTAVFAPLCAIMLYSQIQLHPASAHIDWPGRASQNKWVQSFDWVRLNTPRDARFALDPRYMERPGEGFHSFGALAERAQMFDFSKDRGVVATWPALAPAWRQQMDDLQNWKNFRREDFLRLRGKYRVTWVVVERPAPAGLPCPYANEAVSVCKIE
ncbi:MAG TPA: hypothetical protein VGQ11_08405, partial [Candidatus Acidoferrales bacterium]|nr:hypothetical protein [Candidatus Acidoferrales bacterium]